ncbi:hypothetical protein VNO78_11249 [Psophocarpus tetragonolobus]|uniref:Uncharacterized protein n=1 Tax=Psophocarpus tetragonolobus TaxID=3891 RepID=A0AAN9SNL4_PSOTE
MSKSIEFPVTTCLFRAKVADSSTKRILTLRYNQFHKESDSTLIFLDSRDNYKLTIVLQNGVVTQWAMQDVRCEAALALGFYLVFGALSPVNCSLSIDLAMD